MVLTIHEYRIVHDLEGRGAYLTAHPNRLRKQVWVFGWVAVSV